MSDTLTASFRPLSIRSMIACFSASGPYSLNLTVADPAPEWPPPPKDFMIWPTSMRSTPLRAMTELLASASLAKMTKTASTLTILRYMLTTLASATTLSLSLTTLIATEQSLSLRLSVPFISSNRISFCFSS